MGTYPPDLPADDGVQRQHERIVRKAEAIGIDPTRVARALGAVSAEPGRPPSALAKQPQRLFGRLRTRRFAPPA